MWLAYRAYVVVGLSTPRIGIQREQYAIGERVWFADDVYLDDGDTVAPAGTMATVFEDDGDGVMVEFDDFDGYVTWVRKCYVTPHGEDAIQ